MEKEQDYEHSYECYEKVNCFFHEMLFLPLHKIIFLIFKAWKLEFEASAPIGFKLAFTYMKCKKFIEAIDVCEKVRHLVPVC